MARLRGGWSGTKLRKKGWVLRKEKEYVAEGYEE